MTFPHDHIREDIQAEQHSVTSITAVSIIMIVAALAGISMVL